MHNPEDYDEDEHDHAAFLEQARLRTVEVNRLNRGIPCRDGVMVPFAIPADCKLFNPQPTNKHGFVGCPTRDAADRLCFEVATKYGLEGVSHSWALKATERDAIQMKDRAYRKAKKLALAKPVARPVTVVLPQTLRDQAALLRKRKA